MNWLMVSIIHFVLRFVPSIHGRTACELASSICLCPRSQDTAALSCIGITHGGPISNCVIFSEGGPLWVKKLYVGNLSYDMTNTDLKTVRRPRQVQLAQVITGLEPSALKGFGFVEMTAADPAEAAINA